MLSVLNVIKDEKVATYAIEKVIIIIYDYDVTKMACCAYNYLKKLFSVNSIRRRIVRCLY